MEDLERYLEMAADDEKVDGVLGHAEDTSLLEGILPT